MRKDTLIAYFQGFAKTAQALGITEAAVRAWGELIPPEMAIRAFCVTDGDLFLDPWMYADWPIRGRVRNRTRDRRFKRNKGSVADSRN